ncbi:molybdopterin/thiamine biosynthesis adenylyltransferase/rhodanese-related sulfurtransferase [Microbacterium natoriense]|uniref:Molybdopterin/thiamine biosynthesis adenylyltransferase/rhodanese-related sulfurtransferase n=1 Tax=Microbacterium natoriense TaxID=284570 RepID=A0AAW8EVU1_9MICO|nr:ThiF family adenylyltransferase [Microbacterium natoriense]MDQ0647451.1 molybdopterin/thiamine biosynthesis adenylyltransferase/rhodanese-related sulfurtransferase [Microbacterium natoriense]
MSLPALVDPGPPLAPHRAARFARHLTLPGVGDHGQRRLAAARVLVIGAGGLGAPAIQYLAAAGVGRLTVIDDDRVELSNLQRQVLHTEGDLGRPKAQSARSAVALRDPEVVVTAMAARLDPSNALALFREHDLVLDGSDNFATRYLSNDAAELTGTPVVWGSIHQFAGQVSVFWPGRGPMLRDLFPDIPDADSIESCATGGVFGVLCGAVGSAMAAEALKLLCGIGEPLIGRLARYDALSARWDELRFHADPDRPPVLDLEEVAVACRAQWPHGRADDISAGEVAARLERGSAGLVVVDVRSTAEREASRIDGSFHVPLERILARGWAAVAEVLAERAVDGRDIVIACQAGIRSARAIDALTASAPAGLPVRNLAGGMNAYLALAPARWSTRRDLHR